MARATLSQRKSGILKAVVEDYIASAEPVASRALAENHPLKLSSASVRNVMSELVEMGYLEQPHTSAGRIPTSKGFRFFVDTILDEELSPSEQGRVRAQFLAAEGAAVDVADAMRRACKRLSRLTEQTGLLFVPPFEQSILQRLELVPLSGRRVLAIFISARGQVLNRVIETDERHEGPELVRMTNLVNEMLTGLTLLQVRERIAAELRTERALYDRLLHRALAVSLAALECNDQGTLFVEEQAKLLEQPDFADISQLRELFVALERKEKLIRLLNRVTRGSGIRVLIGSEEGAEEIPGCTLVASTYDSRGPVPGTVGVIGPTRMPYGRVIPLVRCVAGVVNEMLRHY